MHLSEFKAWFEGFTDGIGGTPSPKQWNKIKERVSQITNDYTPAPVFIRDYVRPYWPHWYETYYGNNTAVSQTFAAYLQPNNAPPDFSEAEIAVTRELAIYGNEPGWRALGRAEFNSLA